MTMKLSVFWGSEGIKFQGAVCVINSKRAK